jgi:flagellar hook protein FlgE
MNGTRVYSRAGNFQTDKSGYVVNPQGARLQVYAPSADGTRFDGTLTDLQVLATDSAPKQTGLVNLAFTLPANASEPTIATFDPSNSNSYNQSTGGVTVYDSLGVSHTQTSYFVKGANANEWQVYNYVDGQSVGAPTTLEFSNSGALLNPTNGQITLDPFTPATGAGVLNLTLDVSGSTQYGEKFALRDTRQDGYASGKLTEISIDTTGVVYARYSNGADTALGQVALTNFNNPQGLQSMGNNVWTETNASGIARTGAPDTSDLGQIQSGSLEASTVDLTEQLVNMIVAQRNFQANAQMVSTQDQITQTVINIR